MPEEPRPPSARNGYAKARFAVVARCCRTRSGRPVRPAHGRFSPPFGVRDRYSAFRAVDARRASAAAPRSTVLGDQAGGGGPPGLPGGAALAAVGVGGQEPAAVRGVPRWCLLIVRTPW